jgi:predicted ATPase
MNKQTFNTLCAEIMEYTLIGKVAPYQDYRYRTPEGKYMFVKNYSPYDNANQLHEVFDKLWQKAYTKYRESFVFEIEVNFQSVRQAMIAFIQKAGESE